MNNRQEKGERSVADKLRWKRRVRMIAVVLFLVIVAGTAAGAMLVLSPNIQTQTAVPAEMKDALDAAGFVVHSSTPVTAQQQGYLYYTVSAGQRVQAGATVAESYATGQAAEARAGLERVNSEINNLVAAQNTYVESGDVEGLLQQRQAGMYDLLDALDAGNYGNVDAALAGVTVSSNKLDVATGENVDYTARLDALYTQKQQLEQVAVAQAVVVAPATGYFMPSDQYDEQMQAYETMQAAGASELQSMIQSAPVYYPDDVVGHIISDYKWTYFAIVPIEDAGKFALGAKLNIAFMEYSETTMPVKVVSIEPNEAAGVAKIELFCEHMNTMVLGLRQENAQIIFAFHRGIRIDRRGLRVQNGQPGVYIRSGNMVYFRKIEILLEDEHYILVSSVYSETNQILMYDEVIVDSGGMELYDKQII